MKFEIEAGVKPPAFEFEYEISRDEIYAVGRRRLWRRVVTGALRHACRVIGHNVLVAARSLASSRAVSSG